MELAGFTDEQLMALFRHGKAAAFDELFRRHRDRVHRLAWRMTGRAADADEILQEAFLRAVRARDRWQPTARVATWLTRIVLNLCANHRRTLARGKLVLLRELPETAGGREPGDDGTRREVGAALLGLEPELRAAVVLRCLEGWSYEEAAEALGVPVGTVKTHVHRARIRLAQVLAPPAVRAGEGARR